MKNTYMGSSVWIKFDSPSILKITHDLRIVFLQNAARSTGMIFMHSTVSSFYKPFLFTIALEDKGVLFTAVVDLSQSGYDFTICDDFLCGEFPIYSVFRSWFCHRKWLFSSNHKKSTLLYNRSRSMFSVFSIKTFIMSSLLGDPRSYSMQSKLNPFILPVKDAFICIDH